jgi:hypothetical protein
MPNKHYTRNEESAMHTITLVGVPSSTLRDNGTYLSFDMEEAGSPTSPKKLPEGSPVSFTVFLNQKQLQRAGLSAETIHEEAIVVKGEITLDVPIEDCPGEIGVICFQLFKLPPYKSHSVQFKKKAAQKPTSEQSVHQPEKEGVEEAFSETEDPWPKGTEDFLPLSEITIPEEFLSFQPNWTKTRKVIGFVKKRGYLDEPITVNRETKLLADGYRRYVVAQELGLELVPVMYEKAE